MDMVIVEYFRSSVTSTWALKFGTDLKNSSEPIAVRPNVGFRSSRFLLTERVLR